MSQPINQIEAYRQEFDDLASKKMWLENSCKMNNLKLQHECEGCGKKTTDTIIETRFERKYTYFEMCFECYCQLTTFLL